MASRIMLERLPLTLVSTMSSSATTIASMLVICSSRPRSRSMIQTADEVSRTVTNVYHPPRS